MNWRNPPLQSACFDAVVVASDGVVFEWWAIRGAHPQSVGMMIYDALWGDTASVMKMWSCEGTQHV